MWPLLFYRLNMNYERLNATLNKSDFMNDWLARATTIQAATKLFFELSDQTENTVDVKNFSHALIDAMVSFVQDHWSTIEVLHEEGCIRDREAIEKIQRAERVNAERSKQEGWFLIKSRYTP